MRPAARRSAHYLERYDDRTLLYDCVRDPGGSRLIITAPRFLNLWAPFRAGLKVGGKPVQRLRRRKWLRCEQITFAGGEGPVTVEVGGERYEIAPRQSLAERFAGLDCLLAVNKNNALHWIADWARYHAAEHGARGVVLFDNGSTDYGIAELAATLSAVPGIEAAAILSAPFPYGPSDKGRPMEVSPRFFQTAMLNIARADALARAGAVLSIDIDEIVVRPDGAPRVFDLARARLGGMVTIQGRWIFPDPAAGLPADQGSHGFRTRPDRKCNRKWCLVPGKGMSRFGWAVHQIGGILQNIATNTKGARLLHCRGTSTGWKTKRFALPDGLQPEPWLAAFMARHFPVRDGAVSRRAPGPETAPAATTRRS